jgi:hypothetical protein
MYPDFKELLSILNGHRVKYLEGMTAADFSQAGPSFAWAVRRLALTF